MNTSASQLAIGTLVSIILIFRELCKASSDSLFTSIARSLGKAKYDSLRVAESLYLMRFIELIHLVGLNF